MREKNTGNHKQYSNSVSLQHKIQKYSFYQCSTIHKQMFVCASDYFNKMVKTEELTLTSDSQSY